MAPDVDTEQPTEDLEAVVNKPASLRPIRWSITAQRRRKLDAPAAYMSHRRNLMAGLWRRRIYWKQKEPQKGKQFVINDFVKEVNEEAVGTNKDENEWWIDWSDDIDMESD
jgi:hypothetical protein